MPYKTKKYYFLTVFFVAWIAALIMVPLSFDELTGYFSLPFGFDRRYIRKFYRAGGGVVFIPMFNQLGFTPEQAVATASGFRALG